MNAKKHRALQLALILIVTLLAAVLPAQTTGVTGDSTINQCETKTYTISVLNNSGNPLTQVIVTAKLGNLPGFSYVNGTSSIDINGGGAFCTANPTLSGTDLVWNIDAQCGGPFTLNNGSTLNVTFSLVTSCAAVSGSLNVRIDYQIGGTPIFDDTGVHSIQVLPGGLTIKKTPNVIPQEIGQNVTWTLTVENTGFGTIKNVVVTDVLGAGLAYVSSSPAGVNSGQTTTWGATEIPLLASMDPGQTVSIDITATVTACEFLDNNADARWGCDLVTPCYDTATTIPLSTATASVQRIVKTPLIQYTPPDVSFNYCDDYADVSFTITNIGDGRAHDVWIVIDFGTLTVSNVSAGAIYNNVNKRFELTNPLPGAPGPGNAYVLSFRLNYNTWCGGSFPAGELLWQNVYQDDCDNDFFPPVELSNINSPANNSSLSVSKSGAPAIVQIGTQVTYTITSAYSGPLNCGSGSTGTVTVVDTIPNGFTVLDAGGGTWVPGGGGTGGTITWAYMPPASLNTSITVQVPDRTQCETYCFTTFTNSISATVVDCCGCARNASASQTTAIECEELVDSEKIAVPGTGIRCGTIQYTNTYIFADNAALDAVDLAQMIFQENADSEQEYVPGSLQVTLSGAGNITACALTGLADTTPGAGGTLQIDFAGCASLGSVRNRTLTITYQLRISESSVGACSGATFYSWSQLDMNFTNGSECLPDGVIHEATTVTIDPPAMSLSITGLGQIIDKCQTQTITMTLTQTSATADPKDVRLVLSGLNYYVVDPGATVCSGDVAPTACTPVMVGDDYVWYFGDGFTASGQRAVIRLTVQKRCSGGGDLSAIAYFDDNCNDDGNYDDACSVTAADTPALLLSGDLLIEKNPEVYYAATNTVEWKIYLTNRGTGTAYNVWLDDVLGAGLNFSSASVSPDNGDVTVTAAQDHGGAPINGCTVAISAMAAGQRREITFRALLIDCNNLTNNVSASWGCGGLDCQTPPVSDSSTVEIPRPLLINTNVITTPVAACANTQGMLTLKNSGQTTCYNLQLTATLPAGLLYIPGTTRWRLNGGGWNGPNAAYDPSPTVSPLQWTSTQIPGLATANPGDTIEIEYDLAADCPFAGGNVTVATRYENPCGQVFNTADSVFTVAFRAPQITVSKTRANDPIGCGELIEWTITVRNTSGYTLPIIWVEDTLDAAFTYSSSVGDPPYTSDNGTFNGVNRVAWELRNVAHNDTVSLTLRATSDSSPCSPNLDNTVQAWWGCGAADGSSATKPGVTPPDNNLCLATTGISVTRTETRQPSVGFLNIAVNPISLNSCDDATELTVTINNPGPTDASNVDLVVTLPAGLTYIANSAAITCGGVLSDPASDPAISGSQLTFYNTASTASNLCDLIQAAGGNDTVTLVFSVRSSCYTTANMGFNLYYYDCCGDIQYNTPASQPITALYPALTVSKTPVSSQVACGANQAWTITVTNNGTGIADVVRVEDTLGDWLTYVGGSAGITPMGGQVYGWEINNLAAGGGTASFTITAQLSPDAPQASCAADLRQNNVRAIWGCGTSGAATDGDPNTQGYDCTTPAWANAPAATLQMPDLIATLITPAISCTTDGNFSGSITVTVRNQGDGIAFSGFTVQVSDGNGWTGSGSYAGDLAAGATTTVTIDVTSWNPDCSPCTYNFTATVDSGGAICECNESNNVLGPQSYSPAIPDLEVASDTLAISCLADGQYRIAGSVTLRNAGCSGTLTQNVPMRFTLLSGAGCSGAQVAQWTETFTGVNIAAGATQTFTITNYNIVGNACSSASGCQFSIRSEADYTNTICECDGTDNIRCSDKTFTITDLRVDSDTLAISCSGTDGQIRIQGNLVVANDGCGANFAADIPIRIRVYNNNAVCNPANPNGNLTFNQAGVNIPAGGTQTFAINRTLSRNLCTNSTGCQVALGVELDYTDAICECSNANNNYCSPNKTVSIPDLQVTGDTLTVTCLQDGQVRVSGTATIANTGCNAAMAGNLPVRFTLFSNINCGGTQLAQWTETFAGANIAAGDSQIFTITDRDIITNICSNSTGCQVSLRIEVDPAPSTICECNGGNNTRCSNKTVSIPDLRIMAVTPLITCSTDGNLTGSVQVTANNNGCGAANNIPVRLASNCGYTFTDQTIPSLAAGASTTLTFTFTPDISRCACTFTASADPDNVICECAGTNNSLASAAYTSPIPDLTITDIDFSNVTCANDNISGNVRVTVNNLGCGTASNFQVALASDGCLAFSNQTVVSLAAGASTTLTFAISGSWADCTDENCQFTATVDPAGAICEYDGGNNTRIETYATTLPDLVVTDIDFSNISCAADSISGSIAVTVRNQGFGTAANFQVSLASDGCLAFGNQTVAGPLAAGASTTVTFPVSASWADCTDCTCSFTATVDPTNTVCECNGANNTRSEDYAQTLPDLRVNSVTPAFTCIGDGNLSGTATVNVSNIGCGAANGVVVRVTSDCGIPFADQTINLAAGASTNLTFAYTPVCASCTCTFTASIDPDNAICECNGANNSQSSAPFTMDVPDITFQSDTLAISCSGGGQVQISGNVTLANNGCGATLNANVPLRFTLYDNTGCSGNIIEQWTQTLSAVNMSSGGGTQAFAITPRTVSSNLCLSSTGCRVSIRIEADYANSICECDGTNNTYCADNKPVDIPDLEVAADTLGVTCVADGQATVSGIVTLANAGCGSNLTSDVPMRFTLYDNTGCSGNVLSQWTQTFSGVNIPAGGSTQSFAMTPQIVTTNLVANSAGCRVSIRIEADYANTICECDDSDNTRCADNKPVNIPDLEVASDTLGVTCVADGQVTVSGIVTLANAGCGSNLTSDVPMRFTLYDNSGCTGNILSQWTETFTGLNIPASGGTQAFTIVAHDLVGNFCTLSTSCQLSIFIEADYSNTICESDGTDDSRCSDKTVAIPNLRIRAEDIVISCTSDGRLSIDVTVTNTGCGPASGIVVDLSDNDGRSAQQTIANLAAAATTTLTFANWISDGNPVTLIFTTTVDTGLTVCECDGSDNTAQRTFTLPNLRLVSITPACVADGSFQITMVIENNGSAAINSDFIVRLADNDGHSIDQNFTAIGGTLPLTAGSQQTVVFGGWTVDCAPTTINFSGTLDPTGQVCESNSGDNTGTGTITINDLQAVSVVPATSCASDGTITGTMVVTVANSGGNAINTDFRILVDDGQGWTSELLYNADLGGTLPIAVGASQSVTFNWTRSFTATPYVCSFPAITVTVDSQNAICECTNTNNQVTSTHTLPFPDLTITAVASAVVCLADGSLTGTTVTVANTGCVAANGVVVRLSSDCGLTFSDQTISLAAGESRDMVFNFTSGIIGCTCNFTASIDPDNTICELDGSNNTGSNTLPLSIPDLEVSGDSIRVSCSTDGNIAVAGTIHMTNNGCGPALTESIGVRFTLFAEPGCRGNVIDQWTQVFSGVNIAAAGGSQSFTIGSHEISRDICTLAPGCGLSVRIEADYDQHVCEWDGTNNNRCANMQFPCLDLSFSDVSWQCDPAGAITWTVKVTNSGNSAANNALIRIYDELPNLIFEQRVSIAAGATVAIPFTSNAYPVARDHSFRLVIDENNEICECNGQNNTRVVTVNCPFLGEPRLEIKKTCPPAQQPGGIYRFEIEIRNSGEGSMDDVQIEDVLPTPLQYVSGSSSLDGTPASDPSGTTVLTWKIGKMAAGESHVLVYSLIAPADAQPGRYCNQAQAWGAALDGKRSESEKTTCCIVLRRETGGCCLVIEERPMGFVQFPELAIAYIEPYFHTEKAMFASYAALHLWENITFEKNSLPDFVRERLKNYALSNVEELYFHSGLGLTLPDGSLWLSYAGDYPQKETGRWKEKNTMRSMTPAQVAFELLAMSKAAVREDKTESRDKLNDLIAKKIEFIASQISRLPKSWKFTDGRAIRQKEKADLYDLASLYFSLTELGKAGWKEAAALGPQLRKELASLDNEKFDSPNLRQEFLFILALTENGEAERAMKKISAFEQLFRDGQCIPADLPAYAMAVYTDFKAGGAISQKLFAEMKSKFYSGDIGLFAEPQADFKQKIDLESLAPLILAFESQLPAEKDLFATTLYRTIEETGLFLKKTNLQVQRPPLNLIKNYPFTQEMLPLLTFIKSYDDMAPIFSETAMVQSPHTALTSENLLPVTFTKVYAPQYETDTAQIGLLSFSLQQLGKDLDASAERVLREQGRSLDHSGKKYVRLLLASHAGLDWQGNIFLPTPKLAVKGAYPTGVNLEPLDSKNVFSTDVLANKLVAEKIFLENPGRDRQRLEAGLKMQNMLVSQFKTAGFVPARFTAFKKNETGELVMLPEPEKADKMTVAKLQYALPDLFWQQILEKETAILKAQDLLFLSLAPQSLQFSFEKELRQFLSARAADFAGIAAQVLACRILRLDAAPTLEKLADIWDHETDLPLSTRMENMNRGQVYHYEPWQILVYLMATKDNADFQFKRTLDYFTYLLESEWGMNWSEDYDALPAAEYWLVKESPREYPEPGDLLNFNVRVENRCPNGLASAGDLPSLFIKAEFTPSLVFAGTELPPDLNLFKPFSWGYQNLEKDSYLQYTYQVLIPREYKENYLQGNIWVKGYSGYQPFGPDSASGEYCENFSQTARLQLLPQDLIPGLVYADRNLNGRKDAGETGIAAIRFKDNRGRLFRSNAEGRFFVPAGQENVAVQIDFRSIPEDLVLISPPTQLTNRAQRRELTYALIPCHRLQGFVYQDNNRNGVHDEGEPRLAGIMLKAGDKECNSGINGEFVMYNLPDLWRELLQVEKNQALYTGSLALVKIQISGEDKTLQ